LNERTGYQPEFISDQEEVPKINSRYWADQEAERGIAVNRDLVFVSRKENPAPGALAIASRCTV
jgi:hypothetical protein